MHITIYNLHEEVIDRLIDQDTDRFSTVTREDDETIDVRISNIETIAVCADKFSIRYKNGNFAVYRIPSNHYYRIEVM